MSAFARRLLPALATLVASTAALLALAMPAHAETAYVSSTFSCGSWGSGQADMKGTVYIACGSSVVRYAYDGTKLTSVTLPGAAYDVAPSPDGAVLYFTYNSTLARMVRKADGSYAYDSNWKPAAFILGGQPWTPKGRFLATDGHGDIYWSNGGWQTGQPQVVVKYAPNGTVKTLFGDFGAEVGQFNVNMGITVSRDGRTIYTVEQVNGRVQRFDYAADGTYRFTMTWGKSDPEYCRAGNFSAPYDIGVDPWGYLYIMDTSCLRIEKYTGNGARLGTLGTVSKRSHGIAVDARGNFFVGQASMRWKRAATNPEPGPVPAIAPLPAPDMEAPKLATITVPDPTTKRTINIGITATDNIGVTEVRVANEDGAWGAWRPFATPLAHTLTAGYGIKSVTVQVRDAAGHESGTITGTLAYRDPDMTAPTLTNVTVPATTATRTINVGVTATDNIAVSHVRFANEDGVWGAWQPHAATVAHTLTAGYGVKGVFVQVRDAAGNESNTVYRTLTFQEEAAAAPAPGAPADVADPVLVTATMPAMTPTREVTVTIEATDDVAVTRVRFANEDGTWAAWQQFAAQKQWLLSANFGPKAVFVQVGDAAGRTSTTLLLRTTYQADAPLAGGGGAPDGQAPVLGGVTLPEVTTTQQVTIGLQATDNVGVAQVRFANEDGTWGAWQAYAAQKQWTLSAGYGPKAVFVQVRDAAGNESNVLLRRTSFQQQAPAPGAAADAADPVLRAIVVPDPARTRTITVQLDATDDIGVTQVRFANEDGNWGAWMAYAPQVNWTLTAGNTHKVVFAQVRDAAGRESNVMFARTTLQM